MFKANEIQNFKVLSDMPEMVANEMREIRKNLKKDWARNDSYHVCFVNEDGTRYFMANRENGFDGYTSGNNHWNIRYGKILWDFEKNPMGMFEPIWIKGKTFGQAKNGTMIPKQVATKAEVMELVKKIGIFNI